MGDTTVQGGSNPYASSDNAVAAPAALPFHSLSGRASFAAFALWVIVALSVIGLVANVFAISHYHKVSAGNQPTVRETFIVDAAQGLIGLGILLAMIVSVVSFSMWMYRAHRNLRVLRGADIEFTPGWSVGWFFVPIMNLFKPYQAMREIWRESNPVTLGVRGRYERDETVSALVGWWWAMWLLMNFVSNISGRITMRADTPDAWLGSLYADIPATVLTIIAAVFAITVVRRITAMQAERHEAVANIKDVQAAPFSNPFAG